MVKREIQTDTALLDKAEAKGGLEAEMDLTTEDPAILLHLTDGRFVAYSGRCTHLSCAVYYDQPSDKLLCPCHEGVFDPRTGPPQRSLPRISLQQDGTMLYAAEEVPGE
jgi:Rieske Fe-S protein